MEEKNNNKLTEERIRRQRVNRLKSIIILSIGVWILLSITVSVALIIKMINLEHKIEALVENNIEVQSISNESEEQLTATVPETAIVKNASEDEPVHKEQLNNVVTDYFRENSLPEKGNEIKEGERQKVYLTFDDGPSENTIKILDILKEKNVKATFFVIGQEDEASKEVYRRIVKDGHTLGMHSYTHKYSILYDSLESFSEDLNHLRTYLAEVTGVEPEIMRFPGGSSNQVSNTEMSEFIRYLNEQGITYYDWNIASGDATSQAYTPDELIRNVMNDIMDKGTSIVLMHDSSTKATTVDALGPMIDQLLSGKVELLPIDENTKLIQHIPADSVK